MQKETEKEREVRRKLTEDWQKLVSAVDQGTYMWLALREKLCRNMTMSRAAQMIGVHPYDSRNQAYQEFTDGKEKKRDDFGRACMDRGSRLEKVVMEMWNQKHSDLVREVGLVVWKEGIMNLGASPDGLVTTKCIDKEEPEVMVVEIKAPADGVDKGIPVHWYCQMLGEMRATKADRCLFLVARTQPELGVNAYHVEWSEEAWGLIVEGLKEFHRFLMKGVPPPRMMPGAKQRLGDRLRSLAAKGTELVDTIEVCDCTLSEGDIGAFAPVFRGRAGQENGGVDESHVSVCEQ